MGNAKKRSPIYPESVQLAIKRRLRSAEESRFGIGPIEDVAAVISGGKTKPNGTARGRGIFPKAGRRLFTEPILERST